MKLKNKKNNIAAKRRASVYCSIGNFDKYTNTGDSKYLNDVHPSKLKKGTKYYAMGEGWEEERTK